MSTPEQIQQDIEETRRALSTDVERLSEKVSPGRVVSRRVDRVKSSVGSVKERVMGSMPDTGQVKSNAGGAMSSAGGAVSSATSSAGDALSSAASSVSDAASQAPQAVRRQAQGNPLAAGLVAFGVGMIVSSMLPASEREKQLASQAQSQVQEKVAGPLQEKAKEMASELQGPAQEAAQNVKEAATQAASTTVDESKSAAQDVKAPLQQ